MNSKKKNEFTKLRIIKLYHAVLANQIMPSIRKCVLPILLIIFLVIFCIFYLKYAKKILASKYSARINLTVNPTYTWPFQIMEKNGSYELQLSYSVMPQQISRLTVPENLVLENSTSNRSLSFDDLVNIPDPNWKLPININVTRTYPQAIDVVDAANRLMEGKPLSQVSG